MHTTSVGTRPKRRCVGRAPGTPRHGPRLLLPPPLLWAALPAAAAAAAAALQVGHRRARARARPAAAAAGAIVVAERLLCDVCLLCGEVELVLHVEQLVLEGVDDDC
jgi:hypothetical protein